MNRKCTVAELIRVLQTCPEDAPIVKWTGFGFQYATPDVLTHDLNDGEAGLTYLDSFEGKYVVGVEVR